MENQLTYAELFDALPIPVFVLDSDIRVIDLNQAAAEFCQGAKEDLRMRWGGDILHCLHASDVPESCGRGPLCHSCTIRDVVAKCLSGNTVRRRRIHAQLTRRDLNTGLDLLITASPISEPRRAQWVLLMVEDITEMSTLKDIIPICMNCKKIRDDEKLWHDVEAYFHQHAGVDFSHGLCPACRKALLP
jgi:PAS domain-containing protein